MTSRPEAGVRISVYAKPRAKTSRIVAADGLKVSISIAATPTDGAANKELIAILAEALDVPKSSLHIALGATSKRKLVVATGISESAAVERLARAVPSATR